MWKHKHTKEHQKDWKLYEVGHTRQFVSNKMAKSVMRDRQMKRTNSIRKQIEEFLFILEVPKY